MLPLFGFELCMHVNRCPKSESKELNAHKTIVTPKLNVDRHTLNEWFSSFVLVSFDLFRLNRIETQTHTRTNWYANKHWSIIAFLEAYWICRTSDMLIDCHCCCCYCRAVCDCYCVRVWVSVCALLCLLIGRWIECCWLECSVVQHRACSLQSVVIECDCVFIAFYLLNIYFVVTDRRH